MIDAVAVEEVDVGEGAVAGRAVRAFDAVPAVGAAGAGHRQPGGLVLGRHRSVRLLADRTRRIGRASLDDPVFPPAAASWSGCGEFAGISLVVVILAGRALSLTDLVGVLGETAEVADRDSAPGLAVSADVDALGGSAGLAAVVTVLDRFLAFDAVLANAGIAA
jgi:hypothetical protein